MEMVIPKIPQLLTTLVGFLLLVWILGKYAWGPIINLLDERRAKIRQDFEDAEKARGEAGDLKADFESKLGDIKAIERERVQKAVKRGEGLADNIVAKAKQDADVVRAKVEQDLEIESQKAQIQLRDTVVSLAIGAAEKVVREKLDDQQHRKLIEQYIDELGELPHA